MDQVLEQQLTQAAAIIEQQVDAEITKMDALDDDGYEALRQKRLQSLKKAQEQKQTYLAKGHGKYEEIPDEKAFFEACKQSKKVVCHFYRDATLRCQIVDKHLAVIAPKHIETKFIKIDAERSKFLSERLRIVVLPTICLAKEGKVVDYIVGFDDLGGRDEFPTEVLEWRLGMAEMINYSGDLTQPPQVGEKKKHGLANVRKTIRGRDDDDSSDDDY